MWYVIIGTDVENSTEMRMKTRPDHVARLVALKDQGRLLAAGPNPAIDAEDPGEAGFTGSVIIAEFDSLESARSWAAADPYLAAGVYADVVVKPYRVVLP